MIKLVTVAFFFALFSTSFGDLWVDYALQWQRQALANITLEKMALPCSQNSFNLDAYLPPILVQYENLILLQNKVVLHDQTLSITDQLNAGIRHINLEAHFIPQWNETLVCLGFQDILQLCPLIEAGSGVSCAAAGVPDLGSSSGCSNYSQSWSQVIQEIATWVNANPGEFLIIQVADFVSNVTGAIPSQFCDPVISNLGSKILTNTILDGWRNQNSGKQWPTLSQVTGQLGKQILLTGILDNFAEIQDYTVNLHSNLESPYSALQADCDHQLSPDFTIIYGSDFKLILQFLIFNISIDGTKLAGDLHGASVEQVLECGFSACIDDVSDDDISDFVWSWVQGVSNIACEENMCAIATGSGLNQTSCTGNSYPGACQSNINPLIWQLSSNSDSGTGTLTCPTGFTFSYPHTAAENLALTQAANDAPVWINVPLTYNATDPICSYVSVNLHNSNLAPSSFSVFNLVFVFFLSFVVLFYSN